MADNLIKCPYDSSHRIRPERYPYHLIDCKRTHKKSFMSVCPFNSEHVIPPSELRHHMATCCDNIRLVKEIELNLMKLNIEPVFENKFCHEIEDWDKEREEWITQNGKKSSPVYTVDPKDTYFNLTKKERKQRNRYLVEKFKLELHQKESTDKELN